MFTRGYTSCSSHMTPIDHPRSPRGVHRSTLPPSSQKARTDLRPREPAGRSQFGILYHQPPIGDAVDHPFLVKLGILVGGAITILKNMKVNGKGLSHISWKIKNVPNHQPVVVLIHGKMTPKSSAEPKHKLFIVFQWLIYGDETQWPGNQKAERSCGSPPVCIPPYITHVGKTRSCTTQ